MIFDQATPQILIPQLTTPQLLISQLPSILASLTALLGVLFGGWKIHKDNMSIAEKASAERAKVADTTIAAAQAAASTTIAATNELKDKMAIVATKAEQAKVAAAVTQVTTAKKLDVIHTLVNGEKGLALKVGADALEKLAAITNDPKDVEDARQARLLFNAHSYVAEKKLPAPMPTAELKDLAK